MTKEEIEELKGLAASMGLYDDKNPCKRAVILGKAIKALEQKPVLDKIRAEIDNTLSDGMIHKKTVLGIIDKYISGK